ncbi:hypothetical protein NRP93_001217 [Clostridium botulinum]|nr:hypothetical protein [Clostridium botulinum]
MNEVEILEMTYFDKATISGKIKCKKSNGATTFKDGPKAKDIKCSISKKELPVGEQTDITNNLSYKVVMFCNPKTDILAGDKVKVILESGIEKTYTAGEPFYYSSHLEVPLVIRKRN